MRPPPPLSMLPRFPVVGGLAMLAIGTTFAWSNGVDVSALFDSGEIRRGELWRLATSALPHSGPFHLIFNVMLLWTFGSAVEAAWGHARTALVLLALQVGSSAAEFAVFRGGVGLSGIGYGLFALLWVLDHYGDPRFEGLVDRYTKIALVAWFFMCIAATATGALPVANVAHGVGALIGGLLGYAVAAWGARRAAATMALAGCLGVALVGATWLRPRVNLSKFGGEWEAKQGYDALMRDDAEAGYQWYKQAVAYRRADASYWFNFGLAAQQLGRTEEAAAAYREAAARAPGSPKYDEAVRELAGDAEEAGLPATTAPSSRPPTPGSATPAGETNGAS